jgi:hypothetical protein
MSYELFVERVPVGQVATMQGMADLTAAFAKGSGELVAFLKTGKTEKPEQLKQDIRKQLERDMSTDLRDTLEGLLKRLPAEGLVSVSSE